MSSTVKNSTYPTFDQLNLPQIDKEIQAFWDEAKIFEKSIEERDGRKPFVFYEGPPSANGKPGIHHVISRALKDLFCRYKTQKGFKVDRKGGWDTHGLPVELEVEKELGITKADIGTKISVEEYNRACRERVMKFKEMWEDLTTKMGYWVDMDNPYVTYERNYMETLWYLLKELYNKDLLYKGYTIQPYSPAAGTQLSTHELNQPGSYRPVKDTSMVAQFKIVDSEDEYFIAWTTTPWTLPSNTALTVGKKIIYVKVKTFNPYTHQEVKVILAKDLIHKFFKDENQGAFEAYKEDGKNLPWEIIEEVKGADLLGIRYEQLMPYGIPEDGDAFIVIAGDFVTTEDGTGIVHTAPSFGADDMKVANENGIGSLTLVDKEGKFIETVGEFSGRYVKNYRDQEDYVAVDVDIAVKLKKENKAFKIEKYEHSYPHCWRTDKPVIYYPLDSWFIRASSVKERMFELNKTINWKPESTGTGRFGKWLENVLDWNLSRSRYWGTPLPIWRTEDGEEEICIGSIEELNSEVDKAVIAGFMKEVLANDMDLHRPYVDNIFLVSPSGKKMTREADLIDVWFDSGAMPYAQWHYPFENKEIFDENYPADFIAEGVDQTRGWFYTLHAIATMLFDQVAYKNVVSNGLVLDKNGLKMSKSKGNAVDPFETLSKYGADVVRWYVLTNSQPWDNLKFDHDGLDEAKRKFFGTLYNTYAFFALYANIDEFSYSEKEIAHNDRPEIDRWILSALNSLVDECDKYYADYEPTKAGRSIQGFVVDLLSNWYVRLCRRRFWKGSYSEDKISAYQTLYICLTTVTKLMAPIAPFFSDHLYRNLNGTSNLEGFASVHLSEFPEVNTGLIDKSLEERMAMAQKISSMVLSLRKKEKIKVRQPLNKILLPIVNDGFEEQIDKVQDLILSETNIKGIEFIDRSNKILVKEVKPNYAILGKKLGPKMKSVAASITQLKDDNINRLEQDGKVELAIDGGTIEVLLEEVEISYKDIPGLTVAGMDGLTVALDIDITKDLEEEGHARELVNKIQNIRKDIGLEVTDKIILTYMAEAPLNKAISQFKDYICSEILAESLKAEKPQNGEKFDINGHEIELQINKNN